MVDSDPIAFINPYPSRSTQRFAIPFDTRLVVFADIVQLAISSSGTLTSKSSEVDVLTQYEFAYQARPQPSNGKLYFVAPHGDDYSTIYEMATDKIYGTTSCDDLSESIPRFIPAGVDRVANCPVNYTICYGKSGDTFIYPHLFRYRDKQRVQNAFLQWTVPEGHTLGGMWFKNTKRYALVCGAGYAAIVMTDFAPATLDPDASSTILTYLDMRVSETQVSISYNATTDITTVTLPYATTASTIATVRAPGGFGGDSLGGAPLPLAPEGYRIPSTATGNQLLLAGNWATCPMFFGHLYTSIHGLTRFYALAQDGTPLRSGRLSLRKLSLDLAATGYLRVEVTATGRPVRAYEFGGYRYDDPSSFYDKPPLSTGVFPIPLMGENEQTTIQFIGDSHFGFQVLGFEWRGELNLRAQRL